MPEVQVFTTHNQITDFHIPGNGVIINGLPPLEKKPILSEVEILKSKVELLESEIQKTREEAYQEGFTACKRSMKTENDAEIQTKIKVLDAFKNNLEVEIKNSLANIHQPIMNISSKIAEKILESELKSSEKIIKTIQLKLDNYCNELANQSTINIKVHPDYIKLLQDKELNIDSIEPQIINLTPDESLKPGECIIESDDHIIDAKFQTQISHIINQISK